MGNEPDKRNEASGNALEDKASTSKALKKGGRENWKIRETSENRCAGCLIFLRNVTGYGQIQKML